MKKSVLPGINIQWPWSRLLLSGEKTVETRSYPLPNRYVGQEVALIETPGKHGAIQAGISSARIIGTVTFASNFKYETLEDWLGDFDRHRITAEDSLFAFTPDKEKWGWVVEKVRAIAKPVSPPSSRGIVYARNCVVPSADA